MTLCSGNILYLPSGVELGLLLFCLFFLLFFLGGGGVKKKRGCPNQAILLEPGLTPPPPPPLKIFHKCVRVNIFTSRRRVHRSEMFTVHYTLSETVHTPAGLLGLCRLLQNWGAHVHEIAPMKYGMGGGGGGGGGGREGIQWQLLRISSVYLQ